MGHSQEGMLWTVLENESTSIILPNEKSFKWFMKKPLHHSSKVKTKRVFRRFDFCKAFLGITFNPQPPPTKQGSLHTGGRCREISVQGKVHYHFSICQSTLGLAFGKYENKNCVFQNILLKSWLTTAQVVVHLPLCSTHT